jgi:uncharacterized membrane protein YfcA
LTPLEALAVLAAGFAAGGINAIVGSGSLVTFPVLLAVGYAPVVANVSNTVGLVLGNVSAVWGYRRELAGQRNRCLLLGSGTALGAGLGGALLLILPEGVFEAVVPVLILFACGLMILRPSPALNEGSLSHHRKIALVATAFLVGIYGGYFGAAQGVLLIGLMGVAFTDSMQHINAVKNVLAGLVNGIAAIVFVIATHIDWGAAGLIAAGAIIGGQIGARVGRKLPPWGLRVLIICVGVAALVKLLA